MSLRGNDLSVVEGKVFGNVLNRGPSAMPMSHQNFEFGWDPGVDHPNRKG